MTSTARTSVPIVTDVKSGRSRDLLRGLLSKHPDANIPVTFSNLMSSLHATDLPVVDSLLRESPLFKHLNLREEFPRDQLPFFQTASLTIMPGADLRIRHVTERAKAHSSRVAASLLSLSLVNEAIFDGDDEDVLTSFNIAIDGSGHSLALARKLAYVLGYFPKDSHSWSEASKWFAEYGLSTRNFGMMAVADSIGDDFSYLDIKRGFGQYLDIGERSTTSQNIAYLSFYPLGFTTSSLKDGIAASYALSLTDAVVYVLAHRELGILPDLLLHPEIEQAWKTLQTLNRDARDFLTKRSQTEDAQTFRLAPAFLEIPQFREFRASTQRLYDLPERRRSLLGSNKFEDDFYSNVATIKDLLPSTVHNWDALPERFSAETAGSFSRSCGLVRAADRDPDFNLLTRQEMGALMASTMEVDRLLETSVLRSAAESASDDFVILILRTLLRAHSPSTKDNFQFKRVFQRFVRDHHEGSILGFIKTVHQEYPAVVGYYLTLLDETMLSQLPLLVLTAEDVFETRAGLLEWYSGVSGDRSVSDKAKQLRIDRKISAVRGQINETRLNIDSPRFRQWIDSTKLQEFSGLVRQTDVTLPPMKDFRSKRPIAEMRLIAHRDPSARAALAVIDCYREFCINADFGVASYLGRRIRHGTLRGTLLDGLPAPSSFSLSAQSQASFDRWLDNFRASIDTLLGKLHFSGKVGATAAIISPEVDSREKWAIVVNCLIALHERAQEEQGVTLIPLIVEQYCWFILEEELRDVQAAVLDSRSEFGVFKSKHQASETGASGFEKAVNIALGQRFATVASWFRKPPNISPVASLSDIAKVILQEVRAEYPDFCPDLQLEMPDLQLSGGVYYHIYDALSVIIRNAGKHGARPGILSIAAATEDRERGSMLQLAVTSAVRSGDSGAAAIMRMRAAEQGGPKDADVVEGLSGMRKLVKMKLDKTLFDRSMWTSDPMSRELTVSVSFPLTGLL